jgi:fructose-bisphosphate aldolase class I
MAPHKGILAADESVRTMNTRLSAVEVEETPEMARQYRDVLFTTKGLGDYLSGVILFDQTIRQMSNDRKPFARLLEEQGIMPGIKVDLGLAALPGFPEEEVSIGLDDLDRRLDEYYEYGARFTKWRSVIRIGQNLPTQTAIEANAHVLARYAAIVQAHHMVPMIEPEVLYDGTHTIERSAQVIEQTLKATFAQMLAYRVSLPGLILKTSMALPGKDSGKEMKAPDVGRETVYALKASVPKEVAGIVFLSGGQTPRQATENLNAIANSQNLPWPVTFSYSRAIEEPVLAAWRGKEQNRERAQEALIKRLQLNVAARDGVYKPTMETAM